MSLALGWVGCGRHARQMLLPQLARTGFRLAAVCDSDEGAARTVAADYGADAVFSDYRDLLAHRHLDAVALAVGPAVHHRVSLDALARGLPVFMEKPPAADLAGTKEIEAAAKAADRPVFLGFMKRYATGNRIAKSILDGDFGSALGINATYMTAPTYFEGEPDYTGFYLHHCVHYMDLVPWLMGAPIETLSARCIDASPGKRLFHLALTFSSGAVGTIVMGTIQSRGTPMESIVVMGDHKRVEIQNVINVTYHRDPPFKADDPAATLVPGVDTLTWTPNFTAAANEDFKGYAALFSDVARALNGEPNRVPTISDGVAAMANLERMVAAIDEAAAAA